MCFYSPRVYHPLPSRRPYPPARSQSGRPRHHRVPRARGTSRSHRPSRSARHRPPRPAPATAPAEPSRIGRVISIVRWLIAYGTLLATAVREHPAEPLARTLVYWFQTRDLGVILRRLTRGLMRAAALEAWLRERAAGGHELRCPTAIRLSSPGNPRSGPPAAGDAKAPPWWHDPNHVPTMEEAAAEVRARPEGAVIADIVEDLRVLDCDYDRATWNELKDAINCYGGDHVRLLIRDMRWRFNPDLSPEIWMMEPAPPWQPPPFPGLTPACARPP